MLSGFKKFILRGNVVDLAVGVVIGSAFGNVVNAIVKDLITPLIGVIVHVPSFANMKFTIRGSEFMYGEFLNALISFFIMAAVIYFFVVLPVNTLIAKMIHADPPPESNTKKCPECLSEIPKDATRCAHCGIALAQK